MIYIAVTVKDSHVGGKGLFVDEPIKKGQKILKFDGPIVSWGEAVKRGRENHVVPIALNKYVDIGERESLVNHSCDPSMGFSDEATLIALRDLHTGDEITFDYSLVTADGWTMHCKCGSKECRHIISDYADLSDSIKEKYRAIAPPWILRLKQ